MHYVRPINFRLQAHITYYYVYNPTKVLLLTLPSYLNLGIFANMTQNLKSNTKLTYVFFWNFDLPLSPLKFRLFTKMPSLFVFFLKMDDFHVSHLG